MKGAFRVILPPLLVAIVSIAVTGWGITLGLPSSQRLESIFPNRAELEDKSQELARKMKMTEDEIKDIMKLTLDAMSVSPDAEI